MPPHVVVRNAKLKLMISLWVDPVNTCIYLRFCFASKSMRHFLLHGISFSSQHLFCKVTHEATIASYPREHTIVDTADDFQNLVTFT